MFMHFKTCSVPSQKEPVLTIVTNHARSTGGPGRAMFRIWGSLCLVVEKIMLKTLLASS